MMTPGALVLSDGSVFEGELIGAIGSGDQSNPDPLSRQGAITAGEVVFNTALVGYQEIITDPSYAGQMIAFTYPHIGNYGVSDDDNESRGVFARGVIVRDLARLHSNHRATGDLNGFLADRGVTGISGVDTRRLTRHLRTHGALSGAIGRLEANRDASLAVIAKAAKDEPGTDGVDLVAQVTTPRAYQTGNGPRRVVALDLGIKTNILSHLGRYATVDVLPGSASVDDIMAHNPDGVFLSNGPGDPTQVPYAIETVTALLGQVPVFGICLGHQILSLALGGNITKLAFGHHGANHPVRNNTTGKVEITSQNHNFAVEAASVETVAEVTHVNLNDGVCEGLRVLGAPAFSVQHHPEAAPGPHDSAYLFEQFEKLMDAGV